MNALKLILQSNHKKLVSWVSYLSKGKNPKLKQRERTLSIKKEYSVDVT